MEGRDEQGAGRAEPSRDLSPEQAEECRDSASEALADLPAQERDLDYAVAQFPPGLQMADWKAAVTSSDPREHGKANQVLWPFVTIVNHLNMIVMNGTVVTGLMDVSQLKRAAPAHYRALERAGVLGSSERRDLDRLNQVRVRATHWYSQATPEELHEGIALLRKALASSLRDRLEEWVADEVL